MNILLNLIIMRNDAKNAIKTRIKDFQLQMEPSSDSIEIIKGDIVKSITTKIII
jgi:hypothetical protein